MKMLEFFIVAFVILGLLSVKENKGDEIISAVVIHRHGVREILTKLENGSEEFADLRIFGEFQMTKLGEMIGNRYRGNYDENNSERFDKIPFISEKYRPDHTNGEPEVYIQTSSVSRAKQSSAAFLRGFFKDGKNLYSEEINPDSTNQDLLPVKINYDYNNAIVTSLPEYEDIYLRGWMNCPRYRSNLNEFFESDVFSSKDAETYELRNRLFDKLELIKSAKKYDSNKNDNASKKLLNSLQNWWNIYDNIVYTRIYDIHATSTGNQFSDEELIQSHDIASWLENHKFDRSVVGNVAGGMMTTRIKELFDYFVSLDNVKHDKDNLVQKPIGLSNSEILYRTWDAGHKRKLHIYSAHYPTILSVGSAMGFSFENDIPNFASAVLIELIKKYDPKSQKSKHYVQMLYVVPFEGVHALNPVNFPSGKIKKLKFSKNVWGGTSCEGKERCDFDDFKENLNKQLGNFNHKKWCDWCYTGGNVALKDIMSLENFIFCYPSSIVYDKGKIIEIASGLKIVAPFDNFFDFNIEGEFLDRIPNQIVVHDLRYRGIGSLMAFFIGLISGMLLIFIPFLPLLRMRYFIG